MFSMIKELLLKVWDFIKKTFLIILNFFKNIISFFKTPSRLKQLEADKDKIAVAIKEKLENGDYQVVNCLFDKGTNQLVTPETDAEVISAQNLDSETIRTFGTKDMLVIQ